MFLIILITSDCLEKNMNGKKNFKRAWRDEDDKKSKWVKLFIIIDNFKLHYFKFYYLAKNRENFWNKSMLELLVNQNGPKSLQINRKKYY